MRPDLISRRLLRIATAEPTGDTRSVGATFGTKRAANGGSTTVTAVADTAWLRGRDPSAPRRRRPSAVIPTWYKDAVIYELHVRAFYDSDGDGSGDFQGLTQKLDYLADLGVTALWLLPFYPVAGQGRRLRHRRLHLGQARIRDAARRQGADQGSPQARPAGHHRAGLQPHQRPASVVPARPPRAQGQRRPRLLRLDRRSGEVQGRADHLQGLRAFQLDVGSGRRAVLLAPLLLPPARPELREPARPRGAQEDARLLARPWHRRPPPRRRALSLRARGHQLREPARDPRVPEGAAGAHRRQLFRPDAARRGQPVARGRGRVLRQRRRVPHVLPLPGHAADVHGRAHGGPLPALRHHGADAGHSRTPPSGRSSCATTTS